MPTDPGLITLVTLLRFLGIGTDPEQISHRFGGSPDAGVWSQLRRDVIRWQVYISQTTVTGAPDYRCSGRQQGIFKQYRPAWKTTWRQA
jgi:hypothetical protein